MCLGNWFRAYQHTNGHRHYFVAQWTNYETRTYVRDYLLNLNYTCQSQGFTRTRICCIKTVALQHLILAKREMYEHRAIASQATNSTQRYGGGHPHKLCPYISGWSLRAVASSHKAYQRGLVRHAFRGDRRTNAHLHYFVAQWTNCETCNYLLNLNYAGPNQGFTRTVICRIRTVALQHLMLARPEFRPDGFPFTRTLSPWCSVPSITNQHQAMYSVHSVNRPNVYTYMQAQSNTCNHKQKQKIYLFIHRLSILSYCRLQSWKYHLFCS